MKEKSFGLGVVFMLSSAASLSLVGLLGKLGLNSLSLTSLIFWRYFGAFILCLILVKCMGKLRIRHLSFSQFKLHFLRAFLVLGAQYTFFYYADKSTLLNATVLLNTGPIFISLIDWGVLRKKTGKSTWVGVLISFIGILCLLHPNKEIFSVLGLVGLFSGAFQGASQVVFGLSSQTEKSDLSVLYLIFTCSLLSLVPALLVDKSLGLESQPNISMVWMFLGLGLVTALNQIFRAEAYRHSSPSSLSTFLYFSVLLAGLWDWLFFSRTPSLLSFFGAFLVVAGGGAKVYLRHRILQKKE